MSAHALYGTWNVVAVLLMINGQMRQGTNPRGEVRISTSGRIDESVSAQFGQVPFPWQLSGTCRIQGQTLITRVEAHNMSSYVGREIARIFEFQPGSNDNRMMLFFRSPENSDMSSTFGLVRAR